MWKTFRVDALGNMRIATKVWSDFSATIPLIRSFSLGDNFPPQYPLFAGPPIRYHFAFFAVVGLLEKAGIPLDWALNSLSALGFSLLLAAIYKLSQTLFKSSRVAIISVVLFLFNGSFAFLEFFKKHPISLDTPVDILKNTDFSSFGPYDEKVVSAFWSLNIYTNQRHLALAYAAFLTLIFIIYKASKNPKKLTSNKAMVLGILIGLFPFVHLTVFGMMGIALISSFILYPELRSKILAAGITAVVLSLPQIIYMGPSQVKTSIFAPGYLVKDLTLVGFSKYWFFNLGLAGLLAPIGFILADKRQRKIFIPFLFLFIVGNLFQFSPDIPTNHKFFNLFVIGANIFTAYFLIRIWQKMFVGKILAVILIIFLTLSGIIDLFPILNDRYMLVADISNNETANYIASNTPKDSVFLNAVFLFDPASLAGRKIYLGWPYFSWGAGYDTTKRHETMKTILSPKGGIQNLCSLLVKEGINYIEMQKPTTLLDTPVNYSFFENNFPRVYYDPVTNIYIYKTPPSCNLQEIM